MKPRGPFRPSRGLLYQGPFKSCQGHALLFQAEVLAEDAVEQCVPERTFLIRQKSLCDLRAILHGLPHPNSPSIQSLCEESSLRFSLRTRLSAGSDERSTVRRAAVPTR